MKIPYPFEFDYLRLTQKVLDVLGFSEYWAGADQYGSRSLDLGGEKGPLFRIWDIDETEDENCGYGYGPPVYTSQHFCADGFQKDLNFLHELYENILTTRTPEELERFVEITKRPGVNMHSFIKSWIEYKEKMGL